MPDYLDPEWIELEEGETAELEGIESGWTDQGALYADLKNCIAITAYNLETGVGGITHLVVEDMQPEEVTEEIRAIWHDSSNFAEPQEFNWYAAGGYPGDPDYIEPFSRGVKDADRAYLCRIHTDKFFEQLDANYHSEWLDDDTVMRASLSMDENRFSVSKMSESGEFTENLLYDSQI